VHRVYNYTTVHNMYVTDVAVGRETDVEFDFSLYVFIVLYTFKCTRNMHVYSYVHKINVSYGAIIV